MPLVARYFGWRGRIGRVTWFARSVIAGVVAIAFGSLARALAGDPAAALVAALYTCCAASLAARRLHDCGRSAWSMAVAVVPIVGPLWLLFQLTRPSVEGRNRFGGDPDARLDYLQVDIAR